MPALNGLIGATKKPGNPWYEALHLPSSGHTAAEVFCRLKVTSDAATPICELRTHPVDSVNVRRTALL
jgi:hypothetical protein